MRLWFPDANAHPPGNHYGRSINNRQFKLRDDLGFRGSAGKFLRGAGAGFTFSVEKELLNMGSLPGAVPEHTGVAPTEISSIYGSFLGSQGL